MDNEMIERCEAAINKLQDTGEVIGVKQVVIEVIKAMSEPTEKMVDRGNLAIAANLEAGAVFKNMIDVTTGDA